MDAQLESFKASISLVDVAINSFGFEVDLKDSCKSSTVLRAGGDKLVVSKHKTLGHDVYFGRDPSDRGSVIDLCNFRLASNDARLIPVRQLLRGYLPDAAKPAARRVPKDQIKAMVPALVPKDLPAVQAYVRELPKYSEDYLKKDRGLDSSILGFFPVRVGKYGNAIFVHTGKGGEVCGYEIKNRAPSGSDRAFTGFAEGGEKGLFIGAITVQNPQRADFGRIDRIAICEAAIDAISYAQLCDNQYSMYISTGGSSISPGQEELLVSLFQTYPDATIIQAGDNDGAGDKHSATIASLAGPGRAVERDLPLEGFKDWNAELLYIKAAFA